MLTYKHTCSSESRSLRGAGLRSLNRTSNRFCISLNCHALLSAYTDTHTQTHTHTHAQTDRHRQTDSISLNCLALLSAYTDRQTDRQIDRHRQTQTATDRHRQTPRQHEPQLPRALICIYTHMIHSHTDTQTHTDTQAPTHIHK